jgi:cobalamin biosynthesis Mg chelatase CobN
VKHIVKSLVAFIVAILLATSASAEQKTVHVKGYTKKDGTHVAAHERKAPSHKGTSTAGSGSTSSGSTSSTSSGSTSSTSSSGTKTKQSSASTQPRDSKGRFVRSEQAKHDFEKLTGYPKGRPGYIVDHIIPLACGGPDTPTNMQWQTVADAKAKDAVERKGCS